MIKPIDYLIIGAGPAGLQMAFLLEKNKQNYLVLESGDCAGTFFQKFPRHRKLISINKVFTGYDDPNVNLRWDWHSLLTDDSFRFTRYTTEYFPDPDIYLRYLNDFAEKYRLNIRYKHKVASIAKNKFFIVTTENNETFHAHTVIIATGVATHPYTPDIPGIEHTENYADVSLNTKEFENKRVLIIGKGNSAFETANHLVASASLIHLVSPHPLKMAWQTHHAGHLRAVNNNILDTYQLKAQNIIINANIENIAYVGNTYKVDLSYTTVQHAENEAIEYDRVICCCGFRLNKNMFAPSCRPKLAIHDRLPALQPWYESENIPNLYFAGTLMQQRDFKKKQSGFVHGFRYNIDFLARYLMHHRYQQPLHSKTIDLDIDTLTQALINRINQASGLWQQTGYLADILALNFTHRQVDYYIELPLDFAVHSELFNQTAYFTLTLEFGQERIDNSTNVFAIDRVHRHDYHHAEQSTALHPVIRCFYNQQLQSTHHILEDLAAVWGKPIHTQPLQAYLQQEINKIKQQQLEFIPN